MFEMFTPSIQWYANVASLGFDSTAMPGTLYFVTVGSSASCSSLVAPDWMKFHVPPPDGVDWSIWVTSVTDCVLSPPVSRLVNATLWPRMPPFALSSLPAACMPWTKASLAGPAPEERLETTRTLNGVLDCVLAVDELPPQAASTTSAATTTPIR